MLEDIPITVLFDTVLFIGLLVIIVISIKGKMSGDFDVDWITYYVGPNIHVVPNLSTSKE